MAEKYSSATNIDDDKENSRCKYFEPDFCPRCNTALRPDFLDSFYVKFDGGKCQDSYSLWVLHYCPKCRKCFLTEYENGSHDLNDYRLHFMNPKSFPQSFVEIKFPYEINEVSSRFVEIYNQSARAENDGLSEIAGMGYRKSLEILIIDYCLRKKLVSKNDVEKNQLGKIISEIDDENIKITASRAAWLGNDHSHYFVKHTDRDINDLKALINLTVKWIDNILSTERYESEITKK